MSYLIIVSRSNIERVIGYNIMVEGICETYMTWKSRMFRTGPVIGLSRVCCIVEKVKLQSVLLETRLPSHLYNINQTFTFSPEGYRT